MVFGRRIALEDGIEAVRGRVGTLPQGGAGHLHHLALGQLAEPGHYQGLPVQPTDRLGQHVARGRALQKLRPVAEDLLELLIDQGVGKEQVAGAGRHGPVEQGVDGEADEPGGGLARDILIGLGRRGHDAVEQDQEVVEALQLDLSERRQVLVTPGLPEHGVGLGVQQGIRPDQILQLGDGGHQRPRLLRHIQLEPFDPACDVGLILWHPATGAGLVQSGFNGLVHDSSPRIVSTPRIHGLSIHADEPPRAP
ncbi:hypothetical protein D3C80_1229130 [compost metagenome]